MCNLNQSRPLFLLAGLVLFFSSCASYTKSTRAGIDAFSHRDFGGAEKVYSKADEDGVDQLVYLFDRATIRFERRDYQNSIKDFRLANDLSEIKDYTSLATELAAVITNESVVSYKGEEFEHVLVSMYLALNFAAMGKDEEAIVACRQVNRKLERLRDEAKRHYSLNAFAQYLSALLFERGGDWNNAYVGYKKAYDIAPEFEHLKTDLVRGALEADSSSDLFKWKKTLGVGEEEIREAKKDLKDTGGIVLLFQNGFAPEKIISPTWYELPEYRPRFNRHKAAHLFLNGKEVARTEVLYDIEKVAIQNLKDKYATLIAKRVAGVVGREVIGNQLDKQATGLGAIAKLALYATSRPDLRSWLTLPKDFQVARVQVNPGTYKASLRLENQAGELEGEKDLGEVEVKRAGDISLLSYRSLND